jgi:hypothetical protein
MKFGILPVAPGKRAIFFFWRSSQISSRKASLVFMLYNLARQAATKRKSRFDHEGHEEHEVYEKKYPNPSWPSFAAYTVACLAGESPATGIGCLPV